jgi:hypothetical protein
MVKYSTCNLYQTKHAVQLQYSLQLKRMSSSIQRHEINNSNHIVDLNPYPANVENRVSS